MAIIRAKKKNLAKERPMSLNRDDRIKVYNEMLSLGDEMMECDSRKILRKTTTVTKSNKTEEILTTYEQEEIEFS